jgi:hypothetical protein
MWFDFVQLAGLDERREHCPIWGASVVACEERVFALQRDGADCALNGVAVHLDAAIGQEQDQPIPVFGDIFERVTSWGFGGDLCAGMVQPCFEGCDLGCAFGLAQRQSIPGRCAAGLLLDPVRVSYVLILSVRLKALMSGPKIKPASPRLIGNQLEVQSATGDMADVRGRIRAWYRVKGRDYFARRIDCLVKTLPWVTKPPPFRLLDMTRQWGSCSPAGEVILNPHLIKAPRACIDYVLVHELAHLKHQDQGSQFWNLIDAHAGDWRKAKHGLHDGSHSRAW